jgi:hypothetical protein
MRQERLTSAFDASTSCRVWEARADEPCVNTRCSQYHQYHSMAQQTLPDDILHLLCDELANLEQFDTLFNCACSSRTLAVPALTHLYR